MRRIYAFAVVAVLSAMPLASSAQTTTTSYTYDDLGRLKTVSYPSGAKSGYNYDSTDSRTFGQTATNGVLDNPPGCGVLPINITGVPGVAPPISVTGTMNPPCSDPDNDPLTVISPASAPTFTLAAGQSYSYNITVSDGRGGIATGTITYHRQ